MERHVYPIEVFLADLKKYREGILEGGWLKLPVDEKTAGLLKEKMAAQDGNGIFIFDIYCRIETMTPFLEHACLDELNELAVLLDRMPETGSRRLRAALEYGDYVKDIDDLLEAARRPERFVLLDEIRDYSDLAAYYLKQLRKRQIGDLKSLMAYLADRQSDEGRLTGFGYLFRKRPEEELKPLIH